MSFENQIKRNTQSPPRRDRHRGGTGDPPGVARPLAAEPGTAGTAGGVGRVPPAAGPDIRLRPAARMGQHPQGGPPAPDAHAGRHGPEICGGSSRSGAAGRRRLAGTRPPGRTARAAGLHRAGDARSAGRRADPFVGRERRARSGRAADARRAGRHAHRDRRGGAGLPQGRRPRRRFR